VRQLPDNNRLVAPAFVATRACQVPDQVRAVFTADQVP
jgi:hypothetical protein